MIGFFESLKKPQKGASLIELLLYFSLLGILLTVVTDVMLRTSEFSLEAASKNDLQGDVRFITSRLAYDIHQASLVTTPANLGDSSQTLVLTIGTETHTYTLSGSNLAYEKTAGASTQTASINSNKVIVTSLNFQRLGNNGGKPTVRITIGLEAVKKDKSGPAQKTVETVVGIR